MFQYEKMLQYPVHIKNPNPAAARFIMSQYGGPDGELGASVRYLSQRFSMPYPELRAILTDIGISCTEPPLSRTPPQLCRTCPLPSARTLSTLR